jgi:DNA invertase Pin-like site-specific DNA recombinase
MNNNEKAIALCRVSTVKQSIEGTSLEAQEQRVYDAASVLGTEILKPQVEKVKTINGRILWRCLRMPRLTKRLSM